MKYQPQGLIAEVTHRCPLHCVYCSNPLEMQRRSEEISTEDWSSIFRQAGEMGVLQLSLTGGEPLAQKARQQPSDQPVFEVKLQDAFSVDLVRG